MTSHKVAEETVSPESVTGTFIPLPQASTQQSLPGLLPSAIKNIEETSS